MKHFTPLFLAVLLVMAGCSKRPPVSSWTSSDSIVIEPGVSIGPLRSGMTMQQAAAELGESDQREEVLRYPNLGLTVLPAKGGLVGTVICVGSGGSGPDMKSFAGRTKEGVGIGSSRADVIKAYGEPTAIEPVRGKPANEILRYKPLGLDFKIEDGKVYLIAVFFRNTA
jgi:hypothetical protein